MPRPGGPGPPRGPDPRPRRPDRLGQERPRHRAGPAAGRRDRERRLAAGLPGPRRRDRQADRRGAGARSAPPPRRGRAGGGHGRGAVRGPGGRRPSPAIAARGRLPLVVGGTGLYLRALLHGVVAAPGRDPALRARLEEEAARARAACAPRAAGRRRSRGRGAHPAHGSRPDRAGPGDRGRWDARPPSSTPRTGSGRSATRPRSWPSTRRGRSCTPASTPASRRCSRAACWRRRSALLARHGGALPARIPIGYAEAAALLRGELSRPEAVRRVQVAHRRYARRQVMWLRKEPGSDGSRRLSTPPRWRGASSNGAPMLAAARRAGVQVALRVL